MVGDAGHLNAPDRACAANHGLVPAAAAFAALFPNVHVPRCTSAMFPAGKPAKLAGSHPDVVVPAGVPSIGTFTGATAVAFAVMMPEPEYCIVEKSSSSRRCSPPSPRCPPCQPNGFVS